MTKLYHFNQDFLGLIRSERLITAIFICVFSGEEVVISGGNANSFISQDSGLEEIKNNLLLENHLPKETSFIRGVLEKTHEEVKVFLLDETTEEEDTILKNRLKHQTMGIQLYPKNNEEGLAVAACVDNEEFVSQ